MNCVALQSRFANLIQKARYFLKSKDSYVARTVWAGGLALADFEVDRIRNTVCLRSLEIELQLPKHQFILRGLVEIQSLVQSCGARLERAEGELIVSVQGVRSILQTYEEILQLHEIYVAGVYGLRTQEQLVVVDVGMNVGFATLYFATQSNIEAVIAFEPFKPTFTQGSRNLVLCHD